MPNEQYEPIPFVDTAELTRSEWQEYRKHGFGASDMPVVMEQSEYKSVLALFQEKVSRRSIEEIDLMVSERKKLEATEGVPSPPMFGDLELIIDPGEEFNLPAECGNALEQVVGKYLSVKMGVPVYKNTMMYRHPIYPFLLVDLDYMAICPDPATGELNRRVIVECKTVTHWKENDVSFGPLYPHIIQCRAEMAVMNADEAIIVYLCDNNDSSFYAYRIYHDYSIEAEMIQTAKNLWMNHLVKEILPIPTVSSKAAWRELGEYAFSENRYEMSHDLSEQRLWELSQQYIEAKAAAEEQGKSADVAKIALEKLQLQLVPFLLSQKEVVCGDLTLRWRQKSSRSMDYDAFRLAHPFLYAKYVAEKTNTSFEAKMRKKAALFERNAA